LSSQTRLYCEKGIRIQDGPFELPALGEFAILLETIACKVFGITAQLHIFYDRSGGTIAFNRGRTLFFNYRYYLSWHADSHGKPDRLYFWFMTFCHELAHNEHGPHDETHEYYMSGFAEQYLDKLFDIRAIGI
ncbi:hypothetical protein HDU91_003705, partial [Kappamyces sp. JEL0680]